MRFVLFIQESCDFCIVNAEIAFWGLLFWVSLTGSIVYIQKWIWLASWDQIMLRFQSADGWGWNNTVPGDGRIANLYCLLRVYAWAVAWQFYKHLHVNCGNKKFVQLWKRQQQCWWQCSVLPLFCASTLLCFYSSVLPLFCGSSVLCFQSVVAYAADKLFVSWWK